VITVDERTARDEHVLGPLDAACEPIPNDVIGRRRSVVVVEERQPLALRAEKLTRGSVLLPPPSCRVTGSLKAGAAVPAFGRGPRIRLTAEDCHHRHLGPCGGGRHDECAEREHSVVQMRRESQYFRGRHRLSLVPCDAVFSDAPLLPKDP
jgi:hypothetical protein